MSKEHPFFRTLGPGPYTFAGFGQIHFSETFGAKYVGPHVDSGAGTCAHCGHGIMNIFVVKRGDGRTYGVGSDCIGKLHCDDQFKGMGEFERTLKELKRKQGQERREKQRQAKRQEAYQLVKANEAQLKTSRPKHTAQWANWMAYANWYLGRERTLNGYKFFIQRLKEQLYE